MSTAQKLKTSQILTGDFNNPTRTLNTARETILELRKQNEVLLAEVAHLKQFQELAYEDALSGLMNRRAFDRDVAMEIARAQRQLKHTFSLVVIDLNDFKLINDERGHHTGDETIQWVAQFLKTQVRLQDVVYRLGGDEFAILMPDTDNRGARTVMSRMFEVLALCNESRPFPIRMSMGASTFRTDATNPEKLLDVADQRMYQSKKLQKAALNRTQTVNIMKAVS